MTDTLKDVNTTARFQFARLISFGLALAFLARVSAAPAAGPRHKLQISDPALAAGIVSAGGHLIADYGGFQLYDAPADFTNFPSEKVEARDHYNSILLNASALDSSKPETQSLRKTVGGFAGKRLHLVQFAGPVLPEWRKALLGAGAQVVTYIPQNTFLLYGDSNAIARVQAMAAAAPHVQWEGAYLDDYKIHPAARRQPAAMDQFAIQLVADDAANPTTLQLIDRLKVAPVQRQNRVLNYVDIVVRITPANLPQIAARPDVISIQPYSPRRKVCERQDQIVAGSLSGNSPSGPGYLAWLEGLGFSQSQFNASHFLVDMSDSGIDNGTTTPNHFGLYPEGDTNMASRVYYNFLVGTPNSGSTTAGCDGHGNLNTHIVCGYDNGAYPTFADGSGYHYGLGTCPFALVGSSVVFDPDNFTSPNYSDLISQAYHFGARISNDSWGGSGSDDGNYDLDAQEYDALVRDAQPAGSLYPAAGNQEMVIVFAAGNDTNTITDPGTAKNVITVGAGENVQPFGGADGCGTPDSDADNANAIIFFSGAGPCNDGRHKPDLVAPGTHVSGGAPQAPDPGPTGTAASCFFADASGVCGGVGTNLFFPADQQFYTASTGTSHSTPCVTGGCALVRQYFINQTNPPPSPAMTKAFLMNSARYMTGSRANDTLWSDTQGMGEMNLGMAFDGTPRVLRDEAPSDLFTASGQTRTFTGTIADSAKPFRVTVAWTDAPGNTTGAAYNNDLDLTVTVGGNTYKGNVFSGSHSVPGGSADAVDNVESVFLPPGVSGSYTVTITGTSINSVGVPNANNEVNQDFALVIYNAGDAPVLVADGSILTQEGCTPTNGVIDPGENVTVALFIENVGTVPATNLVATLLGTNGIAFPSSAQSYGVLAPGVRAGALFSFEADAACGQFITATLQLQDGAANLGAVSYDFQLGKLVVATNFSENFDEVSPPNLPADWTTSGTSGLTLWSTETGISDSGPNAVSCPDSASVGEVILMSPAILLPNSPSQLSFRQSFNLEDTYDGGVLEISIAGAGFTDILKAGGSFVTGGYVETITDSGDTTVRQKSPLYGRYAWSGTTDGFMTTIVNLPASAQGKSIQLRWICGTDYGNVALLGTGGWWIDSVVISTTNTVCCHSTQSPVPTLLIPTNGFQSSGTTVEVSGTTDAGAAITVLDGGVANTTVIADANGIYEAFATLPLGSNSLSVTNNGTTDTSGTAAIMVFPAPPTLKVAGVSLSPVAISGAGAPGAVVNLFTNGALVTTLAVNSSGGYSGSVALPVGTYTLAATETLQGLTSVEQVSASVDVVQILPPTIVFPPDSFATNNTSLKMTGTGESGATVTVFDQDSASLLGTTTVNSSGKFSFALKLAGGAHGLYATETKGGATSLPSDTNQVTVYLAPTIVMQPASQTGFLKGTVIFSSYTYGASPLHYTWKKNGATIAGAGGSNLTLANLTAKSEGTYEVIVANRYGTNISAQAALALAANPFATNIAGAYYGLFAESSPRFESSGYLTLSLTTLGKYSARVLNEGGSYSFSGLFNIEGDATASLARGPGKEPLALTMKIDLTRGTQQITGQVSDTNWSATLQAGRAFYSAANPYPSPGKYTLLFGGTNDGNTAPGGDGYGTVTISKEGLVSLHGVLSDNTSVAPSPAAISQSSQWPLYIPLYGKLGSVAGWVDFAATSSNSFAGTAAWYRTGPSGKLYPKGFTNALSIAGSTFAPGNSKTPVLDATTLTVVLSGGGLTNTLVNDVNLYDSGKLLTNGGGIPRLTLSVSPSTGVLNGSFDDPTTGRTTPIKGVVFQQQTNAGGFFLATKASGNLVLTNSP